MLMAAVAPVANGAISGSGPPSRLRTAYGAGAAAPSAFRAPPPLGRALPVTAPPLPTVVTATEEFRGR